MLLISCVVMQHKPYAGATWTYLCDDYWNRYLHLLSEGTFKKIFGVWLCKFQRALLILPDFDLEKERTILDEQGLRIAENQENSQKNRRKLAESTRGILFCFYHVLLSHATSMFCLDICWAFSDHLSRSRSWTILQYCLSLSEG